VSEYSIVRVQSEYKEILMQLILKSIWHDSIYASSVLGQLTFPEVIILSGQIEDSLREDR